MPDVIRVVLADDHPIVRDALRRLLDSQADMRVVGEAEDGEAACQSAHQLAPDVLVMDLSMPRVNGVEATERVRRESPGVKIVALTVHEERYYITQLLRCGAAGYVLKRAAPSELVNAVRTVAAGGTYLDPAIAGTMVKVYLGAEQSADDQDDRLLSDREREVLIKIARGFSNKEVASQLGLSVKTVETYKSRVAEKLGLRSRVEIVRYAAHRGWLAETEPSLQKEGVSSNPDGGRKVVS
ncbi:MAG TPA: response regulator transcription factor [Gemmatimonadaceae bacterium]|nr:response regulator transcription factor [Gemmatimonadaceae bacterium]